MAQGILKEKKTAYGLIGMLSLVYFSGYIIRYDYTAVLAEIIISEGFTKANAALATTACFITYGVGQLISGWLGDRISPKWMITCGLFLSGLMNFFLPYGKTTAAITALWAVNGFAQALLWPPIVRIMAGYMPGDLYRRGCVIVSVASSGATVLLYLVCPFLIRAGSWKTIFRLGALLAAAVLTIWTLYMTRLEKNEGRLENHGKVSAPRKSKDTGSFALISTLGLLPVMGAIVMQGILRDGVTTWLPTYLVEVFRWESASSILSSVLLPLFSMLSFPLFSRLNQVFRKGETVFSAVLFLIAAVFAAVLALLSGVSAVLSILTSALLIGCMHGINLMLICELPGKYAATGRVSFISGLMNSCTYLGSALSTWGFARMAQSFGWQATVILWVFICAAGCVLCQTARKKN